MDSWWGKGLGWKWSYFDLLAIYSQNFLVGLVTKKLDSKLIIFLCTGKNIFLYTTFF
jgi:hypothetical protein